ncbi:MAG: phosphate/phosphite/phosphonate ABC transporter substrate-binding protein [Inquilinus sp.]|nr:phosphate/phosphite/phosphonate ABC transporter substrate-binding protein [Inquilinus sp.]
MPAAPAVALDDDVRLTIGRISPKAREQFTRLRALATYLEQALADDGVASVDVLMEDDVDGMRQSLRAGKVDLLSETAFTALTLVDEGEVEILLREWRSGVAEYHTVFFARRDSGIERLDDLDGRTIAFEDPGSTSAYLVPRVTLEQAGFELIPLNAVPPPAHRRQVGYVFAEGEVNIVARVHRGWVDAGVVSNLDWEEEDEVPSFMREDLVVIHGTPPLIRSLMLVRADLDPTLKERISEVLQQMHLSAEGREVLDDYYRIARFDRLVDDALVGLETARQFHRFLKR